MQRLTEMISPGFSGNNWHDRTGRWHHPDADDRVAQPRRYRGEDSGVDWGRHSPGCVAFDRRHGYYARASERDRFPPLALNRKLW